MADSRPPRVEEMTTIRATPAQAMRVLITSGRFAEWVAPDITVTPLTVTPTLSPGDRFRLEVIGGMRLDYQVEAATDREIVFAFHGPWSGEERWSFIADGEETIVRRVYEVRDGAALAMLVWQTVGRPLVSAHFKLELARFRDLVEASPGPRGEIEAREPARPTAEPAAPAYPVDEG